MHGKEDGKVNSEAAPDEEVVDGCPIACIQPNLQKGVITGRSTPKPTHQNHRRGAEGWEAPSFLRDGHIPAH